MSLSLEAIQSFIIQKIAPGVVSHGGQVEIMSLVDRCLTLGLSGACSTCSLDAYTKEGIATYMLDAFPDLDDCQVVDIEAENPPLDLKDQILKSEA